ncbi:MAG: type II secretion system GspH family protein [Gammaproteobacteria bacterium]|nr:type II secretion system GspH family protein [Gammaproteobacteria bacterium]
MRGLHSKGFSLFELVLVLTLIGVLIAVAIDRLPVWQGEAERAAVETVAGSLRSALSIKVASYIARGETARIAELEASNPVEQLAEIPANYLGQRLNAGDSGIESGNWYFDASTRELVYRVRYGAVDRTTPVSAEMRYAVELAYEDRNRNGRYDAQMDRAEGVRLTLVSDTAHRAVVAGSADRDVRDSSAN